jgi:hypothetical protein
LLYERSKVLNFGILRTDYGIFIKRFVDKSRWSNETKKGLLKKTKSVNLLCCASIESRWGKMARLSGNLDSSLWFKIKDFNDYNRYIDSEISVSLF